MLPQLFRIRRLSGFLRGSLFLGFVIAGTSCEKIPGTGGTGSISGTLQEQFYNEDFTSQIIRRPAVDEEVFLLYGEDKTLGDRTFTGIKGDFIFRYLYPGRYYLYYKTEDTASPVPLEGEAFFTLDLERGEHLYLGNLQKVSSLDYDDGSATIRGVVKEINYVNDSSWPNLVIEYIDYAMEQEIYLIYGQHEFYDERIRTQYNGYFEFGHLIPGDYQVFLYSEDVTGETERVPLKFEVTISDFEEVVDLGEITIEKL